MPTVTCPNHPTIQRGDVLMYRRFGNKLISRIGTDLVNFGEKLEDPGQSVYYCHTAIALGNGLKFEANGLRVQREQIQPDEFSMFDVFRPVTNQKTIEDGLAYVLHFDGQKYDYLLIADDILRYSTHNELHLPKSFVDETEKHMKICSTVLEFYLLQMKYIAQPKNYLSPQDVYDDIKGSKVTQ